MKLGINIIPIFILILLVPLASYGQQTGTLEIDLKSMSGEMADYHGMALKIYQNNEKTPFKIISSLSGNPYRISLPVGYQYKIEVYANSMYANVGYVNLQNNDEKLELAIPNPGSVLFTAVYNDDNTPINNATVVVKSSNGTYEYWTPSVTNEDGNTIRFWLQPTISNDDHYVVNISIGKNLSYSYSPINILPNTSNNIKIVTPWPSVNPPLNVSIYKSTSQKISKPDGNFVVQLYDNNENKISESKVDVRGEAYFSNLKVGSYILRAMNVTNENNGAWGVATITLDGKQTSVQIVKNQTDNKIMNTTQTMLYSNERSVNSAPITLSQNLQTKDYADLIIDIKEWNTNSVTTDSKLLSDMGIKANHIPFWMTSNAKWVLDGKITRQDFVNAVMYLYANGIIK